MILPGFPCLHQNIKSHIISLIPLGYACDITRHIEEVVKSGCCNVCLSSFICLSPCLWRQKCFSSLYILFYKQEMLIIEMQKDLVLNDNHILDSSLMLSVGDDLGKVGIATLTCGRYFVLCGLQFLCYYFVLLFYFILLLQFNFLPQKRINHSK